MNKEEDISDINFKQIVESAPTAIVLTDRNGKIIYINLHAERLFGYTSPELKGKTIALLMPERFGKIHEELRKAFVQDPVQRPLGLGRDLSAIRKDQTEFPVEIGLTPMGNGASMLVLACITDLSERKKTENRLAMSEALFRNTLESLTEGAQIIDFAWRYVYVNDAAVRQGKSSREELLGSTMMERYPGIEKTEMFGCLKACMEQRTNQKCINEFEFPDGSKGWFELNIQPINEGIFIVSADISERKRAEMEIIRANRNLEDIVRERTAELEKNILELSVSEEKFNKAFHASAAGITISHYEDGSYADVNEAFIEMTGISRDNLLGRTPLELEIIAEPQEYRQATERLKQYGSLRDYEMTLRHQSGRLVHVLYSAETIVMDETRYAINLFYNITIRKSAEQQLNQLNKELEAFSYSVSHDLRAPLRAINGYAQMLIEDFENDLAADAKRLLTNIRSNAVRMGTLIDDLLAFSRLGRKELQTTDINMNDMVEGVLIDLNKSVSHQADIRIDELPPAEGDYGLIHQVWFNLIANAIKYSSKKTKPVVEIGAEETAVEVIYRVRDNGAGFNMKYADKLFGVFQRLHSDEEFEGTGVGLAIVQRIVARHNGRVWAEGEPDKGATFYFSLPKN